MTRKPERVAEHWQYLHIGRTSISPCVVLRKKAATEGSSRKSVSTCGASHKGHMNQSEAGCAPIRCPAPPLPRSFDPPLLRSPAPPNPKFSFPS